MYLENGYKQQYWILHNILCTVHNLYLFMKLMYCTILWMMKPRICPISKKRYHFWMNEKWILHETKRRNECTHITHFVQILWKNCVMITITFCFCYKYFFHNHKHVNCQVSGNNDLQMFVSGESIKSAISMKFYRTWLWIF